MLCISMLVILGANAQLAGGTYTINAGAPTAGTNYQSFTEAVFAITDGISGPVVFNVVAGTAPYNEQIIIYQIPGASAINTVTFNCNGAIIEFNSTSSVMRAGVKLDGADHIIFDSLVVHPLGYTSEFEFGYGFHLLRDADENIIRNCKVDGAVNTFAIQNAEGIVINSSDGAAYDLGASNCDSNLIINNTVIGGYDGIILNSGTPFDSSITRIYGNKLINNRIINSHSAGIYLSTTYNTLVQGNDITNSNPHSSSMGIWVVEDNLKTLVTGNRIHQIMSDPANPDESNYIAISAGYFTAGVGEEITISNNLVYDFQNIHNQTGIKLDNAAYVNIFHNNFSFNAAAAADGYTTSALDYGSNNSNVKFYNNIVNITRGGTGTKYGIRIEQESSPLLVDYNDLYIAGVDGKNVIGRSSGDHTTLLDWQLATGKDFHSVSVDPLFANIATGDLLPTLPNLDNTGTYVGINKDVRDSSRSNTYPDMGAYEFLSVPCSIPPIGGTGVSVPGVLLCSGTAVTLNLSGNSAGLNQTYQWQTSTAANGTYTNIGTAMVAPAIDITASTTLYYRAEVACAGVLAYSVPLQVVANGLFPAGTYTINKTMPTTGINYNSFADAIASLKCGIAGPLVFNVVSGTGPYNEQVVIPEIAGVSATNTITFNGNGQTIAYLSGNGNERAVLKLNGADYITLDSFHIIATASAEEEEFGYGVQLINNADFNTIKNCRITVDSVNDIRSYAGIVINARANNAISTGATGCDNNTITNNIITGGYYGITLVSSTTDPILKNTITNNTIADFYSFGMYITGTDSTLIEGNDIARTKRDNNGWFYGMYIESKSTALTISKNRVHDVFTVTPEENSNAYGIYMTGCDATADKPNVFSNNVLYNFNGAGPQYGLYSSNSDYALYYHNTISLDDTTATSTSLSRGFHQTSTATGVQFKNNNISITRRGTGIYHAIYMNSNGTTYEADNNNYYVASTTGVNNIGYRNSTSSVTLAEWVTASGKDAASLNVDPVFTNSIAGNLSPLSVSLDNKGTGLGIATDINGVIRNAGTPDIGAYEFTGGIVPVTLLNISAAKLRDDVIVTWVTATEINTKHFVIEQSLNGVEFTPAGIVNAAGNSSSNQTYHFTDNKAGLTNVPVLYYRLKQVDMDGRSTYSKIVTVRPNASGVAPFTVYPNPFTGEINTRFYAAHAGKLTIELKDATGRVVRSVTQQVAAGANFIGIDNLSRLPKGMYLVTVTINGESFVSKLAK